MCMWDNRGTLVPTYAILMDNAILLTENPPKSILHTIPLSAIQDISLVRRKKVKVDFFSFILVTGFNQITYIIHMFFIILLTPHLAGVIINAKKYKRCLSVKKV